MLKLQLILKFYSVAQCCAILKANLIITLFSALKSIIYAILVGGKCLELLCFAVIGQFYEF